MRHAGRRVNFLVKIMQYEYNTDIYIAIAPELINYYFPLTKNLGCKNNNNLESAISILGDESPHLMSFSRL